MDVGRKSKDDVSVVIILSPSIDFAAYKLFGPTIHASSKRSMSVSIFSPQFLRAHENHKLLAPL